MKTLLRIGSVAAALAGGLRLIAQVLPYTPDNPGLAALYAMIDIGFLLALVALVAGLAGRIALPGLVLLLAATVGAASIIGPDRVVFGVDFYLAGSALFALALAAATPWLARLTAFRLPGRLFAAAGAFALIAGAWPASPSFIVAGLALAAGFLLLAPALWREAARCST